MRKKALCEERETDKQRTDLELQLKQDLPRPEKRKAVEKVWWEGKKEVKQMREGARISKANTKKEQSVKEGKEEIGPGESSDHGDSSPC